jgi:phage-related minor tail protein
LLERRVRRSLGDFRVVDQAAHGIHAAGELERLDRAIETLVELRNRVFQAAAQVPADGGKQEMRREGHRREEQDQDK